MVLKHSAKSRALACATTELLGGALPRISVMDERVGQLLFNINRSVLRNYAI